MIGKTQCRGRLFQVVRGEDTLWSASRRKLKVGLRLSEFCFIFCHSSQVQPDIFNPVQHVVFYFYLTLTRCTSQIIKKMTAITSKMLINAPAWKANRPSNHPINNIIQIIQSKLSIFYPLTCPVFIC